MLSIFLNNIYLMLFPYLISDIFQDEAMLWKVVLFMNFVSLLTDAGSMRNRRRERRSREIITFINGQITSEKLDEYPLLHRKNDFRDKACLWLNGYVNNHDCQMWLQEQSDR
ncbi:hypothetical protein HHI36_018293 [Cryptolaemus montrouzieri]|uniref:Uncharacterized protein n=1 Tax=Cryptolaemus montrouzieri TaxID=559131 RepID=A0ABD2NZJ4_9CUCU